MLFEKLFGQKDTYCIVPMKIKHLNEVARIERESFGIPGKKSMEVWGREMYMSDLLNDPDNSIYYVAVEGRRVIGYICLMHVVGEGHITKIAVNSGYRRRGIADELMKTVMEEGRKRNITYYYLEVRESNLAAQKLYAKYGFTKTGVRPHYYLDNNENAAIFELGTIPA